MTPTADRSPSPTTSTLLRHLLDLAWLLRRSAQSALEHDVLTVAQATAYSAMIALFPALIVVAAVVGLLPSLLGLRVQLSLFVARVLPSDVSPVLGAYFSIAHRTTQTAGALLSAVFVSLTGASSVMVTLMEGFRRAHELPLTRRSFWPRRIRALALVPLSLLPMALASILVVFGHLLTHWLAGEVAPELHATVYIVAFVLRWTIALAGSVGIVAVIYHLGTDLSTHMRQHPEPLLREPWNLLRKDWSWRASLPGATLATVLWFVSTLLFGYYVTRFANYSRVYGSLGAAIALMFWLYLIAISVLIGAEFNAQRAAQGPARRDPYLADLLWKIPGLRPRRTGRMSN
jgi:membrane protein